MGSAGRIVDKNVIFSYLMHFLTRFKLCCHQLIVVSNFVCLNDTFGGPYAARGRASVFETPNLKDHQQLSSLASDSSLSFSPIIPIKVGFTDSWSFHLQFCIAEVLVN
jgi:hypothetical protein